jgi:hypothetical protein
MVASEKPPLTRIYLLTAWQEPGQQESLDHGWRFHLTDPQTGKRYGFTSAAMLLAMLQQAASEPPATETSSAAGR